MIDTTARMQGRPATLIAVVVGTNTPFWVSDNRSLPVKVYVPGSNKITGKLVRVFASGYITGAITTNAVVRLQYGASATGASNVTVATSTPRAVNSTTVPFSIQVYFTVDSIAKVAVGTGMSYIGNILDAWAALVNTVSLDPALDNATQAFVCSIEFSEDSPLNSAALIDFGLEVIE